MARDRTIDELFRLSRQERRRLRVGRSRPKKYREREKRKDMSRDELLDYLRGNEFRTWRKLEAGREPGEPTIGDYRKAFGSWLEARDAAFGPSEAFHSKITAEYLVKVVAEYGLWTMRHYRAGRKIRPDIVPSYWYVEKEFKHWSTLRYYAERYDARRMLTLYMRLRRRLGHDPTADECRDREVDLPRLINIFGGLRYLRENVEIMERQK
jgi:hypothetical protein